MPCNHVQSGSRIAAVHAHRQHGLRPRHQGPQRSTVRCQGEPPQRSGPQQQQEGQRGATGGASNGAVPAVHAPPAAPCPEAALRGVVINELAAAAAAAREDLSGAHPAAEADSGVVSQWAALPGRYKLVVATSLAFVICNMDKVNISVAIIPMAKEFGWSPTVAGLVQSSFFYGYLLSQIPGGYVASKIGGRSVLPVGVGAWSLATAGVPLLAASIPGLFLSRALVGLGEGVAPSAATDMVARVIATSERSRAMSFIFGGLHVGSLLGLVVAPTLIERLGWPSVFYIFGGMGCMWVFAWEKIMAAITAAEPELAAALSGEGQQQQPAGADGKGAIALGLEAEADVTVHAHGGHGGVINHTEAVPWRAFVRNKPVLALAYTHFCNNWFHYTLLAWLPTYFSDMLSLDLMGASQIAILPPIAAIAASAIAGPLADSLISRGVPVTDVRKAAQCTAFLGPAACLGAACITTNDALSVALIALALGLASFSLAGLYSNHADLSPKYAPVLLGLTNTYGAMPGIIGVVFTGWLFDKTDSWPLALFAPSIFFFLTGSAVYVWFGSAERQDFEGSNQPFAIEATFGRWREMRPWQGASGEPTSVDQSSEQEQQPEAGDAPLQSGSSVETGSQSDM